MAWLIVKFAVTAAMVVAISELAKRSDKLGGLVAALPVITILTLIWLHVEGQPSERITNHAWYTFWYVLPTLPMFAIFPRLHAWFGFWGALAASVALTASLFALLAWLLKLRGIHYFTIFEDFTFKS